MHAPNVPQQHSVRIQQLHCAVGHGRGCIVHSVPVRRTCCQKGLNLPPDTAVLVYSAAAGVEQG